VKVTLKDVEHVAKLARLGLSDDDRKQFPEQLSKILGYAEAINKLDTKSVQPTSHAIPMKNVFREDELKVCKDISSILANAPDRKNNMFSVPRIME
jgi:aspartyl-tRNA(Asn)/glutamyl-tRNA(Gln) amidotransferase subunit C